MKRKLSMLLLTAFAVVIYKMITADGAQLSMLNCLAVALIALLWKVL